MPTLATQAISVIKERDVLVALASNFLSNKSLSAPVLMSLAAALASELATVTTFSLEDKKNLICEIISASLETELKTKSVPAEEVIALKYVIKNVIPHSVDLMYAASMGKLNLEDVKASCWSCLPAVKAQLRGPAWDLADAFVAAAEKAVVKEAAVVDLSGVVVDLSGAAHPVVDLSGAAHPVVDLSGVVVDLSGAAHPVVDLSGADVAAFSGSAHIPQWSAPSNPVS